MPKMKSGTGVTSQGMLAKQGQIRTSGRKITVPDKKGVAGVYGAHPSFPNYPQSIGKDSIPTKFAESPIAKVPQGSNRYKTVNGEKRAVTPSVVKPTTITAKNKYNKPGMMKTGRGK